MRRITLVVTIALMMAAMAVAMEMPAFADEGGWLVEPRLSGQS